MSVPLSVIIIAKNEEKRIKECLESVYSWAAEIVIIDDESTDKTCDIARPYTDKIFRRHMDQEGKQRNFGASKASYDWILILDCDERPTLELKTEIANIIENPVANTVAYWVPQINYLGDVQLKYGGWSNPHIRLYDRRYVRWSEAAHDLVHPGLKVDPDKLGGNLKSSMIHYGFANIEDFIRKVNRQSTLEAVKWHLDGRNMSRGKAMWRTVDRFFRRYIGKKGHKDGYLGFVAAVLSSFYEFAAYSKYLEIKKNGAYLDLVKKNG